MRMLLRKSRERDSIYASLETLTTGWHTYEQRLSNIVKSYIYQARISGARHRPSRHISRRRVALAP